ncbi:ATP-binding protein [Rhodospirillum centenum]|uniref:histidine kinase n=1 Tax=Rhodospirillum centenum (strain ATCC 51521 / SW) TaxID=414684 RepID=B6IUN9_RHOCS|nr:ATP-binding protein [Rhodospirillum centenum]ACI99864.1 signal transduction histidine-protein kinase BarA [Rhodospirillum centenum SW]
MADGSPWPLPSGSGGTTLLEVITRLQADALAGVGTATLFARILNAFREATGSPCGLIGEVFGNAGPSPFLCPMALAGPGTEGGGPDAGERQVAALAPFDGPVGRVMRKGSALLENTPAPTGSAGDGPAPLTAFLGIPIMAPPVFTGLVALGNRPGGYDPGQIEALQPLVTTATALLRARRAEEKWALVERHMRLVRAELRDQKERMDQVIAGTGVGIWDWNPQTGVLIINERWAGIVGYTLAELQPVSIATWRRLVHPQDLEKAETLLEDVFAGRSPLYACDIRMRHKAGHWVWVRDSGRIMGRDSAGRALRMVGTHLDVTEERRTLEQALDYRGQIEAILAAVPDGIMTVDRDLRITRVNRAAEALFGWPADSIVGQTVDVLLPEGQAETHGRLARAFFKTEEPDARRQMAGWRAVQGRKRDGSLFPVLVTLSATLIDGQPMVVAALKDMTVIEQQKADLRALADEVGEQLKAAQAANHAKNRFLAALSHELRTPLNAIIGFSELVATDTDEHIDPEKRREYAADVAQAGTHLLALISDLLDLARIEANRIELEIEPCPPDGLTSDAVRMLGPSLRDKGIELEVAVAPDLPRVAADRRAVQQILTNLLGNAGKFTPKGGRVTVTVGLDRAVPGQVRFTVEDTGCGVPADKLPLLGQPFVQVGDKRRASAPGLGLGLAISRGLVERMGGMLRIESELGRWTRVSFGLPTPGGATPGGATPGGATPGGATPGGATPGGATPGGAVPERAVSSHPASGRCAGSGGKAHPGGNDGPLESVVSE